MVYWKDNFPNERPKFGPTQVQSPSQLVKGLVVLAQPDNEMYKITGRPCVLGEENGLWITVRPWRFGKWTTITRIALADYNVVSYPDGRWHPTKWLEIIEGVE